jgi:hypothetical protein
MAQLELELVLSGNRPECGQDDHQAQEPGGIGAAYLPPI